MRLCFVGPFQARNICQVRPRPGTRRGRADPWNTQIACEADHLLLAGAFSSTQQVPLRTQAKPSTPKVNEEELHVALMTDKSVDRCILEHHAHVAASISGLWLAGHANTSIVVSSFLAAGLYDEHDVMLFVVSKHVAYRQACFC